MTDAQPKMYVLIGTNGTGKSTFAKKMIDRTIEKKGRALIITPHDMEWQDVQWLNLANKKEVGTFTGVRKALFNKETTLQNILNNYNNGLLVFDDCKVYFKNMTTSLLEALLISRRQKNLNQIAVAHGFNAVPPTFFIYANYFVLFRTTDNINKRKNDLNDFDTLKKLQSFVNEEARSNKHFYKIIKNG